METIVYLSPEDAQAFIDFQKHHEVFLILQAQGVFDIGFGKCTLNFAHGVLQNVIKEEVVWKK